MPRYDGSLRDRIREGFSPEQASRAIDQLLRALEASHLRGVFHRDLKPENLLWHALEKSLVVADFGIAHFARADLATAVETKDADRLANYRYAAPEQKDPVASVDHRCDVFAAGLIINELFTNQVPQGTGFRRIGDVAYEYAFLDPIVDAMIAQDPADRIQDIAEVRTRIAIAQEEHAILQRLDEASSVVFDEDNPPDPILSEPMKVVRANWNDGILRLYLNHKVNPKWVWAFNNMGDNVAVLNHGPETFKLTENVAAVDISRDSAVRAKEYFIGWLPKVHAVYKTKIQNDVRDERQRREKEVSARFSRERERLEVNRELNSGT
jgi:serine/threonine protein kinase